jgi:hypothetical protein
VLLSALAVLLLAWDISVAIHGLARDGTKTLGCQQTGIDLVSEVGREGKGAHNLTTLEKGMTMHTTIIKQKTAKIGSASWVAELSASLISFLAVAQPQRALRFASRHQKTLYPNCALVPSVYPSAMLVASDVSQRSYGLVP